jgi:KRAB domain-containing zinc finger protein
MNLSNHKYVHKPPIYICEVCNKKFSSRSYLNQHKKVHSLDTKLICEVCGKIIYTPFSLKIHMRTHTGEKPFQCAACGRCFIAAARLRKHRLVHADRKFRCFTCGKLFYFRSSLLKHQQCHSALREAYKCPICFTLFANSDNMRRHGRVYCKHPLCTICGHTLLPDEVVEENRVTEYDEEEVVVAGRNHIRQYFKSCPVCSQTICGRENMLNHMREYHKDYKPFTCQRCLKTLHTSDMLHLRRT